MIAESAHGIQCHIQAQDMHRGFAENAELPVPDVYPDKFGDLSFIDAARLGYPWHLVQCGCRADMWIEPASRGGDKIHRNGPPGFRIGIQQRCDTLLYGLL